MSYPQLKYFSALLAIVLCAGCATRMETITNSQEGGRPSKVLVVQNPALNPTNGGKLITTEALLPGDIILSAAQGITSIGIRLFSLAPVSHAALYVGNQEIAEAVGEGVRLRKLDEFLKEESVIVAFRHPKLTPEQAIQIHEFATTHVGNRYNYVGVLLHAPFTVERRLCELPFIPETLRDFCVRGFATIQLGSVNNDRFFCSQFVLESYRHAGIPITDADPRMISPVDIMHMREGDVSDVKINQPLLYIGHLKDPWSVAGLTQSAIAP